MIRWCAFVNPIHLTTSRVLFLFHDIMCGQLLLLITLNKFTDMLHHSLSDYVTPAVSVWRDCILYVCRIGLCARDYARVMVGMVLT